MSKTRLVFISVFALLLSVTVPGFGANPLPKHARAAKRHELLQQLQQSRAGRLERARALRALRMQSPANYSGLTSAAKASFSRTQSMIGSPLTNRIGLVAAPQFAAGAQPQGPAITGDFNADGKKDVLAITYTRVPFTSSGLISVSVALGDGDGTFQAPKLTRTASTDAYWTTAVVADFNGDQKDDVVVFYPSAMAVYTSNGDGTFATPVTFNLGTYPLAASALDLNGDNKPDLMLVTATAVVEVLNNGDGTFQAPAVIALPSAGELGIAVIADLNGDRKPDVAGYDYNAYLFKVYLATPDGGFQGPVTMNTGLNACDMAAGDLNGDGKAELAVAGCDYLADNLTIYKNLGDGTFDSGTSLWAGFYTDAVTITDVDGDGKADIIAANENGSDITVLKGNGDGTVQAPTLGYAVGGYPWTKPAVADFNGDGKPDVVVTDNELNFVYLQGNGDGTFRASQNYFAPLVDGQDGWPWSTSLTSGDLNGDGIPDIVVGNISNPNVGVTIFLGKPDGSLQTGVNYPSVSAVTNLGYVAIADFDGDGKQDIAATSDSDGMIHVFRGNGDGTFQPDVTYGSGTYRLAGIVAADFDNDGKQDFAVMTWDSEVVVLHNEGQGGFHETAYPLSGSGWSIRAVDINDDQKLDLVVADYDNGSVDVLLGKGDGTFQSPQTSATNGTPEAVAVADVNGDNKPDAVVTLGGVIDVLLGNGDGTFQSPVGYPATLQDTSVHSPSPYDIEIVDLDGDGNKDLVWVNNEYGTVGVLYGKGDGTFEGLLEFATGGSPLGITVADMNLDGSPDVVTANNDMIGATVLLNAGGNKVTVTASPNPAVYGQTVTLTAAVTPTVKGVTAVPTGAVQLGTFDTTFGTPTLTNGTATIELDSLAPGTYKTSASYSGDSAFRRSAGGISFTVNQATTTTTLVSSADPSITGSSVTFTATVASSAAGTVSGTVTFKEGDATLGTGTVGAGGVATFSTSTLTVGTHSITAVYGGDTNYAGSTSEALSQLVNHLAATTTALTSSPNPVVTGKPVTFTATVSSNLTTAISGTVTFKEGDTTLGTGTVGAGGVATFSTPSLAVGMHNVTAVYGGDSTYAGSTSTAIAEVVLQSAPDYDLRANPTTVTIKTGQTAQITITATAKDEYFNGTISFGCGEVPMGVNCSFAPASLSPTYGHPATTTLTVSTTSQTAALAVPVSPAAGNKGLVFLANLGGIGVFGGLLLGDVSRRKRLYIMIALALIAVMMLGLAGCGSSTKTNPNATPIGQSTVQLLASATAGTNGGNTANHTLTITINVQK